MVGEPLEQGGAESGEFKRSVEVDALTVQQRVYRLELALPALPPHHDVHLFVYLPHLLYALHPVAHYEMPVVAGLLDRVATLQFEGVHRCACTPQPNELLICRLLSGRLRVKVTHVFSFHLRLHIRPWS